MYLQIFNIVFLPFFSWLCYSELNLLSPSGEEDDEEEDEEEEPEQGNSYIIPIELQTLNRREDPTDEEPESPDFEFKIDIDYPSDQFSQDLKPDIISSNPKPPLPNVVHTTDPLFPAVNEARLIRFELDGEPLKDFSVLKVENVEEAEEAMNFVFVPPQFNITHFEPERSETLKSATPEKATRNHYVQRLPKNTNSLITPKQFAPNILNANKRLTSQSNKELEILPHASTDATHSQDIARKQSKLDPDPASNLLSCAECKKVFIRTADWVKHSTYHQSKPHMCSQCSKSFGLKRVLNEHVKAWHTVPKKKARNIPEKRVIVTKTKGSMSMPCSRCGDLFPTKGLLRRHMKEDHRTAFVYS